MNRSAGQSPIATLGDPATIIAAGVLAATLATLCHETLGHGLGCVIDGGRITLLTSIWFRCRGAMSITDAGGPIGSLIGGVAALTFLSLARPGPVLRLVVLLFGGLSLFWCSGQLINQPLFNHDDLFFVARRMGWSWIWRPIVGTIGVVSYAASMWWTRRVIRHGQGPAWPAVLVSYGAGGVSAVVAGAMWQPEAARSALEGLRTLGIMPLGLLVAAAGASGRSGGDIQASIPRSWTWIIVGAGVYGVFLLTQARGLGALASTPLPR